MLCIMLLKTSSYIKITDGETIIKIKKYNVWNKVSDSFKKIGCELMYNNIVLETKSRFCSYEATNFLARKTPEKSSNFFVVW